ncbi:succinylglutamate desuccinylase/aspartoacylase family protein [Mesorhizobium sp. CAU 1741]|uniref:succinylglutamate desuccinylase/aspartoacylase family protein n=1 Tax=Mesorhizobium sp. CAU 1741 TaxID=3140366 RepID=UPI00325BD70C
MISTDVDFDMPGLQFGKLRVPHSVHRSAYGHIQIPIAVAANGHGPTVLLTGGVHGDEYEGPIALARLAREIDVNRVTGRIIIAPTLNHPAFVAGTRVSPIDGVNLNRIFPGRRDGTITEMIAHYVTAELLPRADCLIDLHAGGSSLQYLPTLLAPRWSDPQKASRVEALIDAFEPENVIYFDSVRALSGEDRVIGNYAHQKNVDFLTGEFGGGSSVNIDGLSTAEKGIRGVLAHLGVLPADQRATPRDRGIRRFAMDDPGLYAFADRRGFFEPRFALGQTLPSGAVAGLIHDIDNPWSAPVVVHFRTGGIAMCVRTFSLVEAGDCIGHLASEI